MKIKFNDVSNKYWDEMINQIHQATFNYTSIRINYDLEYLSKEIITNESFIYYLNDKYLFASIVFIIKNENGDSIISYRTEGLPGPVFEFFDDEFISEALKVWNLEIDGIVHKYKPINIKFSLLALEYNNIRKLRHNWLKQFGYADLSFSTRIIDLSINENQLIKEFNKRSKSYYLSRQEEFIVVSNKEVNNNFIDAYKSIHLNAAGRKTRSDKTFSIMKEWIKSGNATLFFLVKNNEFISVVLVSHFKGKAYYGSGATLSEYKDVNGLGDKLHIHIILYLRSEGINFYETGYQYFESDLNRLTLTSKDLSISKFKCKFGGFNTPVFSGEKKLI